MKKITKTLLTVLLIVCSIRPTITNAQYTKLLDFNGTGNGSNPFFGNLISDGSFLYGMTNQGGANDMGTVFKIKPDGTGYTTLLDFSGTANGKSPYGSLISDGTFLYGMTYQGGANNMGTVFKIKPDGSGYTKLIDFSGTANGKYPQGCLNSDGTFLYGMTQQGGTNDMGTVFKIKPDGTSYTKLLDFSGTANGSNPYGSLISDGTFLYGMTRIGGTSNLGTIFKIMPDGTGYIKLLDFNGTANGQSPYGSLISFGTFLFGMTYQGGADNVGSIFKIMPDGTSYTKLLDFSGAANGRNPLGTLISDGTFLYGLTQLGGTNDLGTAFKINPDGTSYTKLLDFSGTANGKYPHGSFNSIGTNLYGMTRLGGANDVGTIFKYSTCIPTTGTDVQTACDSYTWINGVTYTASNNTAKDTLVNAAGCDSVVTLNLTIKNSNTGTDVQTACDSYTWIDGNTYTSSNNTATFTLTNAAGCDSIVTLNLTINNSTTGTDVQTACDTYTWINGVAYTTSNSTATFNIVGGAANGCDSLVTLNLTITPPSIGGSTAGSATFCSGSNSGTVSLTGHTGAILNWQSSTDGGSTWANITGATTASHSYSNLTVTTNYRVVVQSTGCAITYSTTATITIATPPALSITKTDVSCTGCADGSVNLTVSGGVAPYTYSWSPTGNTTQNLAGVPAGTYTVTVTDAFGCTKAASVTITEPAGCNVTLTATTTNSVCGGKTGSATVSITGGTSPYKIIWNTGATTAKADSLSAGLYQVNVTDNNNCSASLLVTISDVGAPAIAINNVNNVTCPNGSNGDINIAVSGGTTPYTYAWSNGATTKNIGNLMAGAYEVFVKGNNGCLSVRRIVVNQPDSFNISSTTSPASCGGGADGSATVSVSGGSSPYTYLWNNGATTTSITNVTAGAYKVNIADINGCKDSLAVAVNEVGAPVITVDNIENGTCSSQQGAIYISVTGSSPFTYAWSNGSTIQDINGVAAGTYTVTVTGNNNCKAFLTETIYIEVPTQEICLVTVDSATGTNLVVWEKAAGVGIASYNIYKESTQAGVYYKIANVPFANLSVFNDTLSNPLVRSWRYKLTALDACGNESEKGAEHKTMHLMVNIGVNNTVNLIWDAYQGFSVPSYYISRYSNKTGWVTLDTIPSTLVSYTDLNPTKGYINYTVDAIHPDGCTSTRANNFNTSRSNRSQSIPSPAGVDPDAINENDGINNLLVYPNPTTGTFTLSLSNANTPHEVIIYDLLGNIIHQSIIINNKMIDLSNHSKGIYFVKVNNGDQIHVSKVIMQ